MLLLTLELTLPYMIKMFFNNIDFSIWSNPKHPNYKSYVTAFWVGLLDGDGSIQVNHWRSKNLQFRMVIKLNHTPSNERLLRKIKEVMGGGIGYDKKQFKILWVENSRDAIERLVSILETYPPITTKSNCQLTFLKKCLKNPSMEEYFSTRGQKYMNRHLFLMSAEVLRNTPYFKPWLSGFIEAEGCWSLREKSKGTPSFSLGQKHDVFILAAMRSYFEADDVSIRSSPQTKDFYTIEFYNVKSLKLLKTHCQNYPLLGEKYDQLTNFYAKHPRID